jgi:23S rRNA (uracil1939-C5)-methyltransferase
MSERCLRITGLSGRGEGVASAEGLALFIAGTLPGEEVVAQGSGTRLELKRIVAASPERVQPFCWHFGRCGGCQLQHWREEPYRAWKRKAIGSAFTAEGIAAEATELIDAHGEGRRRASLHVRRTAAGAVAGYMAARSHSVIDIDVCPILVPALGQSFAIGRALAMAMGDADVTLTATDTGIDVAVKAERRELARGGAPLARLADELGLARLSVNGEVVAVREAPALAIGLARVTLPPGGFLQATAAGEEALAGLVMGAVADARRIADLFCGVGPFALRLAASAAVMALDSDGAAIAALAAAARHAVGLKPVTTGVRNLFSEPLVAAELKGFDAVVFDPPRSGAEAQARQLAKSSVPVVVAVSCDAQSLARDAGILIAGGYRLERVTAVDQFKWSSHVEAIAVFRRQGRAQSLARST